MSHNQSRFERNDSSQYRKSGRSEGSAQERNFSGRGRKGGQGDGTAFPPASSSLASNWKLKKSNNAQGGQSRVAIASLKSDSDDASTARTLQNGSHMQPPVHAAADAPVTGTVTPTTDMATQKNAQAIPKAPSSQLAAGSSDTTAPPNLDEQKRHQARHDSSRAVPRFPIPSVPKQQIPRKVGGGDQSNTGVANQMSIPTREVQISSAPAVTQTQAPSVHPVPGVSMPIPFHEPQVPVQFGGPNTHIQPQGITATSSLPMPFPMGNAPQWQQQVFVPSMQPHPMQPQSIMHQGQNMNFTPQTGSQLAPQLGNFGVSMGSQFAQQLAGKYGSSRIPVKITHPDTHKELRLDGGLSGPRSHPNVPQSQSMTSVPPPHPMNYYPNSFNPNSLYFPGPCPVPLTSNQINPSSQSHRFSYPVSQGPQSISFLNPSAHNSYPNKPIPELNRRKSTAVRGKKKRKEILQKADAARTTSDLFMAYKGPEGKKGTVDSSQSMVSTSNINLKQVPIEAQDDIVSSEKGGHSKSERDDWEDAADISTLKFETVGDGKKVHGELKHLGVMAKKLKKSNNAPGGQSRVTIASLKSDSDDASAARTLRNGSHIQSPVHGAADAPVTGTVTPTTDMATQENAQAVLKAPSSQPSAVSSDITAPPNLDEQKRHQPHHGSSRAVPTFPIPSVPKQQIPRKDGGAGEQSNTGVANQMSKPKREVQTSSAPAATQTHTPSVHPVPGVSMPMPFHQPQVPVQFGGPNTHIQSQGITATSSLPMPFPMGNAPQWQQVFVPSMQPHPMQPQSIMHQGQNMNFTPQMGSQLPPQLGNLGVRMGHQINPISQSPRFSYPQPLFSCPVPVSTSSISEPALKHVGEGSEDNTGLVSHTAAGSKDKPVPELNRAKSTAVIGKKKIKEVLQKADAARTTSNLYMEYKGPEGKKGTVDSSQSMVRTSNINLKQVPIEAQDDIVSSEKGGHGKAEPPDDWEDAADISISKLETVGDGKKVHGELKHLGVMAKKYTRDSLLKLSEQCVDLPEGFEITSHVANLMISNVNDSREPHPSPGRSIESAKRKCASKRSKVKEQKGNVHQSGPLT